MVLFGGAGYLMKKFDYEPALLMLAFVLGPLLEKSICRSLKMTLAMHPTAWVKDWQTKIYSTAPPGINLINILLFGCSRELAGTDQGVRTGDQ
jgi:TctA family transporter